MPQLQQQGADWLELMSRRHLIHALIELDVTDTRRAIRAARGAAGAPLSLTAYIIACLARAIDENKIMHAYRRGQRLILFADVDVTTLVEQAVTGQKVPVPHIIRSANRLSAWAIQREIDQAKAAPSLTNRQARWLPLWLLLPAPLRRFAWSRLLDDPFRRKRLTGTTVVTAVGMFGSGAGWGIPLTPYTLCLTLGGVARRPAAGDERGARREYLCATLTADHDLIDGAPLARFINRLKALVEGGELLAADSPPDEAATAE
jgi:pyruvate/2-oxoglutarate dehydrogenase complex dihydrolipoamide acyltransferase (E2) component